MNNIVLLVSVAFLVSAIRFHALTKINVKTKIEKEWYDRIWSGSRPQKDNLTDEGLKYRRKSNLHAFAGFVVLGLFVLLKYSTR